MVAGNGNGQKAGTVRQPTARYAAHNEPAGVQFVRVICPYSIVSVRLARILQKAGILYGTEPPYEDFPHCTLLCVQENDAEAFPETLAREASPEAPILVFASRNDPKLAEAALRCGARGFVHAEMPPEQLLRALEVVSKGEIAAPRGLLEYMIAEEDDSGNLDDLSTRQREIVELVAEDLSNAQIAKRLFLTESTIKQHLRGAYKILGVKNRTQAVRLVRRTG
ncbi:MAG: hypothetical protein AVDCRST_MAG28-545 [uncultured Rubrobacteraceae bacterium]|uniref:HTH luxR-type domain-containing protein n=1 Tax=uncultured Rubrobacteraceae bacterium TaxID=349277 RepID=A0A6J4QKE1_9ACTN|nr:MAG: hypothetical protein AVDCRST_MAG28-545 [uncultured Rubrobacteraceae bacterium]